MTPVEEQPTDGGTTPPPAPAQRAGDDATRGLGFVTRRPVAITMFMVAMAVFGAVSLGKLTMDLLPEISYPTLTVRTTWEGAAPEDVETRISERLQETLATLPDLVRTTSTSRAGVSDVVLDFDWGTSMTGTVQDARLAIDGVRLPDGSERPLILRYDPNLDPILRVGIATPASARSSSPEERLIALRWLADNRLKRELENLEGVAAVEVRGGLEEEIRVRLDPHRLAALSIPLAEVDRRLAQENLNASGGSLLEGSTEYLVRTHNEFTSPEEIADLGVAQRGGTTIRIRDLGEVTRGHKKREVVTRIAGEESVELAVYREAGANIIEVAERVKAALFGTERQKEKAAELLAKEAAGEAGAARGWGAQQETDFLAWRYRDEVALEVLSDQSRFIEGAVEDVKQAALLGALFAVLVIFAFLRRLSATVVIGTAIPISVVVTFAPMYLVDVSLNIMSLGGLALGVGMLVDNAIVVLESITRCREEGDDLAAAAVRGVREVAGAVTASTLTTIAVFAPIAFVSGVAGQIFGDQAVAVVSSLAVSLVVAVLFIPMLASRRWLMEPGTVAADGTAIDPAPGLTEGLPFDAAHAVSTPLAIAGRGALRLLGLAVRLVGLVAVLLHRAGALVLWPVARLFDLAFGALDRAYGLVLRGALRVPIVVIALAGLLFWNAWGRLDTLGTELLPEIHQGEFLAHVTMPVGTPLERSVVVMEELDAEVRRLDGVAGTALTVGVEDETLTRRVEGPNTARLSVRLDDVAREPELEEAAVARVRSLLLDHPAVLSVEVQRPTPFALDAPVAVEVRGNDLELLAEVGYRVRDRLEGLAGLADVAINLRPGHPEALVAFDRDKTAEYGLDLATISNLVRDNLLGTVSTRFSQGDDRIDVRVQGDEDALATLEDVLDLVVNPGSPTPVTLRAVADLRLVQGPAEIRRVDNSRAVVVTAETAGLDLGGSAARIEAALESLEVPREVRVVLAGQKRELDQTQGSMRFALLLAIFLVYVVMAAQFESLVQPFVILLTVPLAGIGVIHALEWTGTSLSVVVFIGVIMLAGIVVNNAIVLVDRINQKRAAGLGLKAAILDAGRARLRPILMTTATTALGLLPMTGWLEGVPVIGALGSGDGAELRAPMAIAVIAGLVSSTLLTLVVVPTVYEVLAWLTPAGRGAGAPAAPPSPPGPTPALEARP